MWGLGKAEVLAQGGRLDLRRRPRPRRRGRARRRGHQRLRADRRLHPRGAARGGRHPRRARRPHRVPGLARRAPARPRLAALEEDLRRRGLGAGRVQRRSRLGVPAGGRGACARRRANVAAATAYSVSLPEAERDPAPDFARVARRPGADPGDARDGARGLPRQRRRPLLLLQGRAARRARPAGRRRTAWRTSPPAPTPTTRRAGFRPGIRAAAERGAITPLLDAGLTKEQVRAASRRWELPTWDKPAAACLSSRIAYGIEVTPAPAGAGRARRGRRTPRARRRRTSSCATCGCATSGERRLGRGRRRLLAGRWPRAATWRGGGARRRPRRGLRRGRPRPPRVPLRLDERGPRPSVPLNPLAARATRRHRLAHRHRQRAENEVIAVPTGKVKWYDAEKGFGFLSQEDGGDVYVRAEALPDGRDLAQGRHPGRVRHRPGPQG